MSGGYVNSLRDAQKVRCWQKNLINTKLGDGADFLIDNTSAKTLLVFL
jgi:hypothetical protein